MIFSKSEIIYRMRARQLNGNGNVWRRDVYGRWWILFARTMGAASRPTRDWSKKYMNRIQFQVK